MSTILKPELGASESEGYDAVVMPRVDHDGSVYYLASYPELPGCKAHGASPEEALDNLAEALDLYREMATEGAAPLPDPHPRPTSTIGHHGTPTVSGSATTVLNVQRTWSLRRVEKVEEADHRPIVEAVTAS